jgi:hypothetical protein
MHGSVSEVLHDDAAKPDGERATIQTTREAAFHDIRLEISGMETVKMR